MSHQPGIEAVFEAYPEYWRKTPHVKRLVMKGIPEPTTRLAMLKRQEADVAYGMYGAVAEEIRRDAELEAGTNRAADAHNGPCSPMSSMMRNRPGR